MEIKELKDHIDKRLDQLEEKQLSHREEYLREVTDLKTKMNFFKSFVSGVAVLVSAIVSGLLTLLTKHS